LIQRLYKAMDIKLKLMERRMEAQRPTSTKARISRPPITSATRARSAR